MIIVFIIIRYYYASVDLVRKSVKQLIEDGEWNTEDSDSKKDLLRELGIQDPDEDLKNLQAKIDLINEKIGIDKPEKTEKSLSDTIDTTTDTTDSDKKVTKPMTIHQD